MFDINITLPILSPISEVTKPLENADILLSGGCHVDHEGYDLNEIEQAYYQNQGISLIKDPTWYKDGGGNRETTAILQSWVDQLNEIQLSDNQLILDHSHFVYKFPIKGDAEQQIREYAKKRPELLRLVSTSYKCGLDLCIDLLGERNGQLCIQPIVHIEWDYDNYLDMLIDSMNISTIIKSDDWHNCIPDIKNYNEFAKRYKIDAFSQADYRANMIFKNKAYKLIPTL